MRKFYSILLCAVVAAFCLSATAKTFTVKVTDTNAVYVINPTTSAPVYDFDENNSYTFDSANFNEYVVGVNLSALTGYEIVSVLDEKGNSPVDEYIAFPNSSCSILIDKVEDNSTVTVTTREKEKTYITVVGNPEEIYVSYNYSTLEPVDGKWTIESTYSGSFNIYANSGYTITAVKNDNGNPASVYGSSAYVYFNAGATTTYTVETADLEASRTASFTVEVDGNPADVYLSRTSGSYDQIALSEGTTTVKFNPSTETSYQVRHNDYSKSLYKVLKNGVAVEKESYSNNYSFYVEDGDVLSVTPAFPDIDVPVSFSFVNEGTEGIVSEVRLDGTTISNPTEGFTAKLGQSLSINFAVSDFDITEITVNGQALTSYYSYTTTLLSEEPIEIVITATPRPLKKVTILTDAPESFYISTGYNGTGTIYTFTEEETVIEVSNSAYYLYIIANDGYYITTIEHNGNTLSYNSPSVSDGDEIVILTEKIIRDSKLTLYIHPSTDWGGYYFYTGYGTALQRAYQNYDGSLTAGYSHYDFGSADMPVALRCGRSDYSYDMAIYLNGEPAEGSYGMYSFYDLADGDVIKAYPAEPATYTVTYTIADDVEVAVRHDVFTVIENPSSHSVFEGTSVHIAPAATVLENGTTYSAIAVTVNGESLTADENGVYTATISADSDIKVTAATPTGISEVEAAAGDDAPVYNLQGICVGTAADLNRLPAGIYIVNGEKVRI